MFFGQKSMMKDQRFMFLKSRLVINQNVCKNIITRVSLISVNKVLKKGMTVCNGGIFARSANAKLKPCRGISKKKM